MLFGDKILEYWDDILRDLAEVVAIPSVCGDAEGEYPFGKNAAMAVDKAMELADKYGLTAKNVGYYAMHAEIGEGDENAMVMAHLDVVPEGEGWNFDPFTFTVKDGLGYGRGVSDNKGPAIVALHCLRALKDNGVKGNRKLRVVLGSGEEIGMADMEHYFASEQEPTMGFTPDASYGVCNCEKGILHFTVNGKKDGIVKSFVSGTVPNAVPYKAEASVECDDAEFAMLCEKSGDDITVTRTDFGASLFSSGIANHASTPHLGKNAASYLIELLYDVFGDKIGSFLSFIHKNIGTDFYGTNFGVNCEDEPSGKLTFNLGIVNLTDDCAKFIVDIRYPSTLDGEEIVGKIKNRVYENGLEFIEYDIQNPLYLPADSDFIKLLRESYTSVTGEECEVFSMGGGTYARQMFNKGVAFGPGFHDDVPSNIHNCNEVVSLESLKKHAQVCLEAMYRMYTV